MIGTRQCAMTVSGTVEHLARDGEVLVAIAAGCLRREVLCGSVAGVREGDVVRVELAHDLRSGTIVRVEERARGRGRR